MTDVPIWTSEYVGLPFLDHGRDKALGLDCWGLFRLVQKEKFNVDLPSYFDDYENTEAAKQIGEVINREKRKWTLIAPGLERLGDGVSLRIKGEPMHVGLVLCRGTMLHIEDSFDSVVEKYTNSKWEKRVLGFYRYDG